VIWDDGYLRFCVAIFFEYHAFRRWWLSIVAQICSLFRAYPRVVDQDIGHVGVTVTVADCASVIFGVKYLLGILEKFPVDIRSG